MFTWRFETFSPSFALKLFVWRHWGQCLNPQSTPLAAMVLFWKVQWQGFLADDKRIQAVPALPNLRPNGCICEKWSLKLLESLPNSAVTTTFANFAQANWLEAESKIVTSEGWKSLGHFTLWKIRKFKLWVSEITRFWFHKPSRNSTLKPSSCPKWPQPWNTDIDVVHLSIAEGPGQGRNPGREVLEQWCLSQ